MKNFISTLGWAGVFAILAAYGMVSFSLLAPDSLQYQLLNLGGASGIVVSSWYKKDPQPAFLNLVWAAVALLAILKYIY